MNLKLNKPAVETATQSAVIHIGASSIGLLVGQVSPDTGICEVVEVLSRPVPLAADIFEHGYIRPTTMDACTDALRAFLASISETVGEGALPGRVHATNILAEASNEDVFLNRVSITCGMEVATLDDGEMTRLIYFISQRLFETKVKLLGTQTAVCHVGPGNTRILYFEGGKIQSYFSYRLGGFRIAGALASERGEHSKLELIDGAMRGTLETIVGDCGAAVQSFVAFGVEIQLVAAKIGEKKNGLVEVKTSQLGKLLKEIESDDFDELVRRFRLDYHSVEALVPTLRAVHNIAIAMGCRRITTLSGSFDRELLEMLAFRDGSFAMPIQEEVRLGAQRLAAKFQIDMDHAIQVEDLCVQLFDALRSLHHLDEGDKLLLRVAAILHEAGRFVSPKAHHQHSFYLIKHSEIFGLSHREIGIVALVARYHRHSPPKRSHEGYKDLPRGDRLLVAKLASILRLADALERGHSQRVRKLEAVLEEDRHLVLVVPDLEDLSLEQFAVNEKGDLFTQIFGVDIDVRGGAAGGRQRD
ncbi:MAG: HD domain-containing protein [Verrucomicrobia bacterium]|nr:HD domain-containing protein [Verrucomicrobiota bacterium]